MLRVEVFVEQHAPRPEWKPQPTTSTGEDLDLPRFLLKALLCHQSLHAGA
jgi:hypothetical protein